MVAKLYFKFALTVALFSLGSTLECPPRDPASSCNCDSGGIECRGPGVTQAQIDEIFSAAYTLNNPTNDPSILVNSYFMFRETNLTQLDLTPVLGFNLNWLYLTESHQLAAITGPDSTADSPGVQLDHLTIVNTGADDLSLTPLLQMAGSSVRQIEAHYSMFQGEFLNGLATLDRLEMLNLEGNFINSLHGGQIKSNRIKRIGLEQNRISQLGEGAFDLNAVDSDYVDIVLEIGLAGNKLTNGNIHPNNGLASIGRPTNLDMRGNNFVFISQENFETFLYADFRNILQLDDNAFICDQRMKWLKDAKEILESRVLGVFCMNDPGNTIFNTTLV